MGIHEGSMSHVYSDQGTCLTCGCSKGFIDKNNIACVAPQKQTMKLKPKLTNGDIHCYMAKIIALGPSVPDEAIKNAIYERQIYSYHPAEYDWFISEYRANPDRWMDIYSTVKSASQPVDYEEEKWKPKTVIEIQVNPMTGSYSVVSICYGKKSR